MDGRKLWIRWRIKLYPSTNILQGGSKIHFLEPPFVISNVLKKCAEFNHSLTIIKESSLKVVQVIFLHITKPCFTRQPNPGGVYLWKFKNKNLWEFVAHWWSFLTKNEHPRGVPQVSHYCFFSARARFLKINSSPKRSVLRRNTRPTPVLVSCPSRGSCVLRS